MATRLMQMKCQNCGANLNLDLDKLIAFCPYCGAKLMVDVEQLSSVLVEKEKTKQKEIQSSYETKQKEMEFFRDIEVKKIDVEKNKSDNRKEIISIIIFVLIAFAAMSVFFIISKI